MVQQLSTNTFGCARFIVDPVASQGTHTTITAALASAVAGQTIFVRPGVYTENLPLKAGVNLVSYEVDALTPNVTIVGKCTYSSAGTTCVSGIRLQTNGDFLLEVTGVAASIVTLEDCYLDCTNNTGISFTTANASSFVNIEQCGGDIKALGIKLFEATSTGGFGIIRSGFTNSGFSVTPSTMSAGLLTVNFCDLFSAITITGTCTLSCNWAFVSTKDLNISCVIAGVGTSVNVNQAHFLSGTASSIQIDGTGILTKSKVDSSNANAVTGSGTLSFSDISMLGSSVINTTTTTEYCGGGFIYTESFIPTVQGGTVAGVTTYNSQVGNFTRCGNYVHVYGAVNYSAATGTGDLTIGGLPFTVMVTTDFGTGFVSGSIAWPAGATHLLAQYLAGTTTAKINTTGPGTGSVFMQIANLSTLVNFSGMYRIS